MNIDNLRAEFSSATSSWKDPMPSFGNQTKIFEKQNEEEKGINMD